MAPKKPDENPKPPNTLRQRAEALLHASPDDTPTMPTEDVQALVHELNVHQMELEIQNEEIREAQVELSYTRDRFADLYEFAPVGYVTLDKNASMLEANLTAATMLGVDRQDLLKSRMSKFVIRDSQDDCYFHLQAVFSGNEKRTTEIEMHKADSTPLVVRLESIAFDVEGQRRCRTALIDVTATRTAQQKLATSEQRYRRLTDAVIDYIFTVRVENGGEVETIHGPNCEAITGYTPDEFASNDLLWICIVPEEDRPLVEHNLRETLAGVRPAPLEHRIRCKDGTVRWVLRVTSPHLNDEGRLIAYDGLLRDITKRKRAEQVVRESEQFLRSVLNKLFCFVGVLELDGTLSEANDAPLQAAGISRDEVVGRKFWDCFWWNYSTEVQDQLRDAWRRARRGEIVRYDVPVRMAGDKRMMIDFQLAPLRNAEGEITHLIPAAVDITDRKAVEETLQRLNEELEDRVAQRTDELLVLNTELAATSQRMKNLLDNVDVIVSDWQMPLMTPTFVSPYAEEILGYPLEDWFRPRFWETVVLHPDDRDEMVQLCTRETKAGRDHDFVYRARHADGRTVWIHEFVKVHSDSGESRRLTCVMIDVTERKRSDEALRSEHELTQSMIDTARQIILVLDTQGRIIRTNPYLEELTGWQSDEIVGCDWFDVFVPECDRERIRGLFGRATTGERTRGTIDALVTKNRQVRQIEWYDAPLTSDDGELIGLLYTGVDVTERIAMQRRVLDAASEEQRRIGQDLHDGVGQELTGLGMMADALSASLRKQSAAEAAISQKLVDGLKRTLGEVRAISRGLNPVEVDPDGLRSALEELATRSTDLYGIPCLFQCGSNVQLNNAEIATQLYLIAREALNNAATHSKATKTGVTLRVDNNGLCLRVSDNGIGILDDPKLGLGLRSMDYRSASIGGQIRIQAGEHGGTIVDCVLPASVAAGL